VETFRATARVDFIAVSRRGELFVAVGEQPPHTDRTGLQQDADGTMWLVQGVNADDSPVEARVLAARRLGPGVMPGDDGARIGLVSAADIANLPRSTDTEAAIRDAYRHVWLT